MFCMCSENTLEMSIPRISEIFCSFYMIIALKCTYIRILPQSKHCQTNISIFADSPTAYKEISKELKWLAPCRHGVSSFKMFYAIELPVLNI